jgi:hypothetical protein
MSELQEENSIIDKFSLDIKYIQRTNIQLFIIASIFLLFGVHYKTHRELRNEMIKGLFIVIFIQLLDYYIFKKKARFLKNEKYLLSLTSLVGEGLYLIFIKPKI